MTRADPDAAIHMPASGGGYRIHSLASPASYSVRDEPRKLDVHHFVIKAEEHGIPQARHRVILTGVRDDIGLGTPGQIAKDDEVTVERVIGLLPKLRSRLTRETDSNASWGDVVVNHFGEMAPQVRAIYGQVRLHQVLPEASVDIKRGLGTGDYQLNKMGPGNEDPDLLNGWYHDPHLTVWLNHDARGHMRTDLRRYAYAAAFADAFGWSQKGHGGFSLQGLRPNHVNWETGSFRIVFGCSCATGPRRP